MIKTKPTRIAGVPVEEQGEPMLVRGEVWHTLISLVEDDTRVWEWSETSGRVILTQGK